MKLKLQSLIVLFSVGALTASYANAGQVYLDDTEGDLFVGNPVTGIFDYVGTSTRAAIFNGFTDIDFTSETNLYGLDPVSNLYAINPANGHIINEGGTNNSIGPTGVTDLVGLAGDGVGGLWAGGVNAIYTINTTTGAATVVGTNTGAAYTVEGDLEFIGSTLYLTSTGDSGGDFFTVNTSTGVATFLGNTGFSSVFGLAYDSDNATLYGYTAAGTEFQINPTTGVGSNPIAIDFVGGEAPIDGTSNQILGAAFQTPEPGSFVLLSIGFSALLGIGVRRSRRA